MRPTAKRNANRLLILARKGKTSPDRLAFSSTFCPSALRHFNRADASVFVETRMLALTESPRPVVPLDRHLHEIRIAPAPCSSQMARWPFGVGIL